MHDDDEDQWSTSSGVLVGGLIGAFLWAWILALIWWLAGTPPRFWSMAGATILAFLGIYVLIFALGEMHSRD